MPGLHKEATADTIVGQLKRARVCALVTQCFHQRYALRDTTCSGHENHPLPRCGSVFVQMYNDERSTAASGW
jgi:hypothetical protein